MPSAERNCRAAAGRTAPDLPHGSALLRPVKILALCGFVQRHILTAAGIMMALRGSALALPGHKKPFGPAHQQVDTKANDSDQDNPHDHNVCVLEF